MAHLWGRRLNRQGLPDHLGFEPAVDVGFSEEDLSLEFDIGEGVEGQERQRRDRRGRVTPARAADPKPSA